jgi:fatty acid-binding protein DegV
MQDFGVRVVLFGRDQRLKTVEKFFKTETAMQRWCEKVQERPDFHGFSAFTRPEAARPEVRA